MLSSAVRLTSPLVRSAAGTLEPASWEEALDRVAEGVGGARAAHGADAVGVFGGGGLTNEKAYSLGKFARVVLGTSQIDYNGRFCMSSAAAAGSRAFGLDRGLPFPLEDIPRTGCVILVGSNPAETMPPALRYFTELKENGGTLIVVDPRRTRTAEHADLHLAPAPAPTSRWRWACCTWSSPRGAPTRSTSGNARPAGRRPGPPRWRTGRSTWSGSRACPCPNYAMPYGCSASRSTRWCSPRGVRSSSPRAPTR